MKTRDFHYELPSELIAQLPLAERSASRLMQMDRKTGRVLDRHFRDLAELLNEGDLLVFNNTRVIPARLFGHKETGGKVEILLERLLDSNQALTQIRASKSPKPGTRIDLSGPHALTVLGREGEFFRVAYLGPNDLESCLKAIGHMPLPPYIEREDTPADLTRYQTIYGKVPGAVAAPTAGLHFDEALLKRLRNKGIRSAEITLHVGAGTFQPVRVESLESHVMHSEWLEVSADAANAINETRTSGGRVIAVGTTAVRSLETVAAELPETDGKLAAWRGESRLFIYPGYDFRVIDGMITNFHLPESTLLMLVSAFAGFEATMAAYQHAVAERYRFFSYGDAMLIQ